MWCVSGEGTIALLVKAVEWPTDCVWLSWLTSRCVLFSVILSLMRLSGAGPGGFCPRLGLVSTLPSLSTCCLSSKARESISGKEYDRTSGNSRQGQDFRSLDCLSRVSCSAPEQLSYYNLNIEWLLLMLTNTFINKVHLFINKIYLVFLRTTYWDVSIHVPHAVYQ